MSAHSPSGVGSRQRHAHRGSKESEFEPRAATAWIRAAEAGKIDADELEVTEPSPRGRGRPRDPDTDRAILHAAFELLLERGVDGASMEQIARRAGVGKLTVYRRWSSKDCWPRPSRR